MKRLGLLAACWAIMTVGQGLGALATDFDIAPFARRCCTAERHTSPVAFDYAEAQHAGSETAESADGHYVYGLQWAEERDIKELHVHFRAGHEPQPATVQYWFRDWPYPPPHMPTIEDPVDDPWQGQWLKAAAEMDCQGATCRYTFLPLSVAENPRASNLPGLSYRRTLKLRLVFDSNPWLEKVEVFSGSQQKPIELRFQLGVGEAAEHTWDGRVRLYNGQLQSVKLWNGAAGDTVDGARFHLTSRGPAKGLIVSLVSAGEGLPGSQDTTIVTLDAADRTFSFATPDVEKGPVYVPDFRAYVTLASNPRQYSASVVKHGQKIREKLATEPEQTYERASKEIPALDPVERQGGRLYLPLAADASWQKFAFEWGGNIAISKSGTKAMGKELERLEWKGDRLSWRIGTGARPTFRPAAKDSTLSVLENYLPLATARWTNDGLEYSEEGFASLLSGPLGSDDPQRNEQTPAVLMLKVNVRNPGPAAATSHLWLATDPAEELTFRDQELLAGDGQLVRARVRLPKSAQAILGGVREGEKTLRGIHVEIPLRAGEDQALFTLLPFIPRLSAQERARLASLDYEQERTRVLDYWRHATANSVPFSVPEKHFMDFARAVIPHIRLSATKDPKSGLYMVPAASYGYLVYDNEAAFQCVMLDAMGNHALAAEYLESFLRLQGSKPFAGTFRGNQSEVFHGARVDKDYDYTASEYNLDHGVVLWALAEHYFFTRDKDWLRRVAPSMKRAADWVFEQRKYTELNDRGEPIPEYGLLPAGHLEDNDDWGHWFSVNAFAEAGATRLAEALAEIGDPATGHYAQEAASYAKDLRAAVVRASQIAPVVRLRDNTYVPYVPTRPYQRIRLFGPIRVAYYSRYPEKVLPTYRLSATREVLYGPMILLSMGIIHADEPLANAILDDWEDNATMSTSLGLFVHGWVDERYWFSRGGMVFQANLQNPILVYLRRNEIPAAIRNLYNDFVACYYPSVNVFTEEFRQWQSPSGPFYKVPDEAKFVNRLRDTLVREDSDALWLAAGTPRRWLAPGQRIEVRNLATYFGPVSYRIEGKDNRVSISVQLPTRNPYKTAWLVVRTPEAKPLKSVEIAGRPWRDFDAQQGRIRLPLRKEPMDVEVHF
ncbi:MAG TPA: hypothetical protein VEO19_01335 [Terriglobia bacterium]|nr:hypothetical protein [Terriglobia bacterium]